VLREPLGHGGNAEVWIAVAGGREAAVKVLLRRNPESEPYRRFRDEVEFLKSEHAKTGVLPLIEAFVPQQLATSERAFLVTPIATGVRNALGRKPFKPVVEAVLAYATTLDYLAEHDIFHRDLKPDNLFKLGEEWVIPGSVAVVSLDTSQWAVESLGSAFGRPATEAGDIYGEQDDADSAERNADPGQEEEQDDADDDECERESDHARLVPVSAAPETRRCAPIGSRLQVGYIRSLSRTNSPAAPVRTMLATAGVPGRTVMGRR
jgi:protein kinase-like protein